MFTVKICCQHSEVSTDGDCEFIVKLHAKKILPKFRFRPMSSCTYPR